LAEFTSVEFERKGNCTEKKRGKEEGDFGRKQTRVKIDVGIAITVT
jgi:hypothetical protein